MFTAKDVTPGNKFTAQKSAKAQKRIKGYQVALNQQIRYCKLVLAPQTKWCDLLLHNISQA